MINPRPLRIAHVMMIRLSHALDSSTVFPDLEKFIKSKATDAVTTAAMVEIRIIWLYTSFMISDGTSHNWLYITGNQSEDKEGSVEIFSIVPMMFHARWGCFVYMVFQVNEPPS